MFANGSRDQCSILGWVILKTEKGVLDTSLFKTLYFKIQIESKWRNSCKKVALFAIPRCCSYWAGCFKDALDYINVPQNVFRMICDKSFSYGIVWGTYGRKGFGAIGAVRERASKEAESWKTRDETLWETAAWSSEESWLNLWLSLSGHSARSLCLWHISFSIFLFSATTVKK